MQWHVFEIYSYRRILIENNKFDHHIIIELFSFPYFHLHLSSIAQECWNGEPDNQPTINQVVDWLKAMITKTDIITESSKQVPIIYNFKENYLILYRILRN
jgi:hypothetical protein